jgi:DNA helicase HerA-like ATPase
MPRRPRATDLLTISKTLDLPIEAVTETFGVVGIRGSGKTTTTKVLAEELVAHGQQACIIDPLGAYWGLRSSPDGKAPGLPVLVLGGEHGDAPLDTARAEVLADFVVETTVSVVFDLSQVSKSEPSWLLW